MTDIHNTFGTFPDSEAEVSPSIRSQGDIVEGEMLMHQLLLGVPLHTINTGPENITYASRTIAAGVRNKIEGVLGGKDVELLKLQDKLEKNIQEALTRVHASAERNTPMDPSHLQESRAVADAVRTTIPPYVLNEYITNAFKSSDTEEPNQARQYAVKLRYGSDNIYGAAIATTILMHYEDIRGELKPGESGDIAQHAVLKEYFMRYRGLTESEAVAATNYLRARSLLDTDLTAAADEAIHGIFGESEARTSRVVERQSVRVVGQVYRAAGVPMNRSIPDWDRTNFRSLLAAYFALKKLRAGEGPAHTRLENTQYVRQQMREIAEQLQRKPAHILFDEMGAHWKIAGQRKTDYSKGEHIKYLERTLKGEVPSVYQERVVSIVQSIKEPTPSRLYGAFLGKQYGLLTGRRLPISIRNLLYGNKYASAASLYYRGPKHIAGKALSGTKKLAQGAWNRKKGIGIGAFIGTLFLPGIGTAIGAAVGSRYKPDNT